MSITRSSRFLSLVVLIAIIIASAVAQAILHPTVSADSGSVVVAAPVTATPVAWGTATPNMPPSGRGPERAEYVCASPKWEEGRSLTAFNTTYVDENAQYVTVQVGNRFAGCTLVQAVVTKVKDVVETLTATPVVPTISTTATTPAPTQDITPAPTFVFTSTPAPTQVVTATPAPTEEATCEDGNPGNLKCVGKSSEDPNNRGTMPQDNTGGNGNGQHGNQNTGGSGNGNGNGG